MDKVLFITDLHTGAHVIEIAGVFERAACYGWRVIEIERNRIMRPLRDFFTTWRPVGCIMECGELTDHLAAEGIDVPVVYIDPPPRTQEGACLCVSNDADAIAAMAIRELMPLECASFAYVGWCKRTAWSVTRCEAFKRRLAEAGFGCGVFDEPWHDTYSIQRNLAAWLKRRKRRIGVFAANDYVAGQVAGACEIAGLESPSDVAIIGVDNDVLLCENSFPTLSSIKLDFREAGRLAADLLHDAITGERRGGNARLSFGPLSLARRQSTRLVNSLDRRIVRAVERIRRDACMGIKASDIIAGTGLSRRLVEKRFFEATGRTILGEIREVRFEKAFEILRDKTIPVGRIPELCGWESDSYFKRAFKSRTGMTPREWRKTH